MRRAALLCALAAGCRFEPGALGPLDGGAPAPDDLAVAPASGCQADIDCRGDGGAGACCGGACVDTARDPLNCGACGHACAVAHGSAGCAASGCVIAGCDPGFADCDGTAGDGCEADLASPATCGACGVVCGGGCGATLAAAMTAPPDGWSWNGDASYDAQGQVGVLTPDSNNRAGTLVYARAVATDAFVATFQVRFSGGAAADGMGFLLESDGPTAVGANASGLGMAGLHGFGVELDIYDNQVCGDLDQNHVGVDTLARCQGGGPTPVAAPVTAPVTLADRAWHTATVTLAGGAFAVTIDGAAVGEPVALPGFVGGAPYFYGFGGATGGASARIEVRGVQIQFPTARCL